MNEAILRNIIRQAVRQINPSLRDIGFDGIDRLVKQVQGNEFPFRRIDLGGGISAYQESDLLILEKKLWSPSNPKWPQVEAAFGLQPGESYDMGNNWRIESDLMKYDELKFDIRSNTDKFLAWLDHGKIKNGLQVRGKKNGERMQPLGMESGNIKISDVFINEKIPQSARGRWPVICSGSEILWVPGYRIAHQYRVHPATREVLRITIIKNL